ETEGRIHDVGAIHSTRKNRCVPSNPGTTQEQNASPVVPVTTASILDHSRRSPLLRTVKTAPGPAGQFKRNAPSPVASSVAEKREAPSLGSHPRRNSRP